MQFGHKVANGMSKMSIMFADWKIALSCLNLDSGSLACHYYNHMTKARVTAQVDVLPHVLWVVDPH